VGYKDVVALSKAFDDWKTAHDAYIAAERKLADAETVFAFRSGAEPRQLRDEVRARREEADRLLHTAMESMKLQARSGRQAPPIRS
jgi:hypothetical protein